jgi:hypothetical protein
VAQVQALTRKGITSIRQIRSLPPEEVRRCAVDVVLGNSSNDSSSSNSGKRGGGRGRGGDRNGGNGGNGSSDFERSKNVSEFMRVVAALPHVDVSRIRIRRNYAGTDTDDNEEKNVSLIKKEEEEVFEFSNPFVQSAAAITVAQLQHSAQYDVEITVQEIIAGSGSVGNGDSDVMSVSSAGASQRGGKSQFSRTAGSAKEVAVFTKKPHKPKAPAWSLIVATRELEEGGGGGGGGGGGTAGGKGAVSLRNILAGEIGASNNHQNSNNRNNSKNGQNSSAHELASQKLLASLGELLALKQVGNIKLHSSSSPSSGGSASVPTAPNAGVSGAGSNSGSSRELVLTASFQVPGADELDFTQASGHTTAPVTAGGSGSGSGSVAVHATHELLVILSCDAIVGMDVAVAIPVRLL